jgi:hypothetical protein
VELFGIAISGGECEGVWGEVFKGWFIELISKDCLQFGF